MRLNKASDFALRILMLLANEDQPVTVAEISGRLQLVNSHVMKIVAKLVKAGMLTTQRGRIGGVSLGMQPSDILVGDVIRQIETDFAIVECLQPKKCACVFAPNCRLKSVISDARSAFMAVLDKQSLQSIIEP